MFSFIFGVAVGLVFGWTVLPQPEAIVTLFDKIKDLFKKSK